MADISGMANESPHPTSIGINDAMPTNQLEQQLLNWVSRPATERVNVDITFCDGVDSSSVISPEDYLSEHHQTSPCDNAKPSVIKIDIATQPKRLHVSLGGFMTDPDPSSCIYSDNENQLQDYLKDRVMNAATKTLDKLRELQSRRLDDKTFKAELATLVQYLGMLDAWLQAKVVPNTDAFGATSGDPCSAFKLQGITPRANPADLMSMITFGNMTINEEFLTQAYVLNVLRSLRNVGIHIGCASAHGVNLTKYAVRNTLDGCTLQEVQLADPIEVDNVVRIPLTASLEHLEFQTPPDGGFLLWCHANNIFVRLREDLLWLVGQITRKNPLSHDELCAAHSQEAGHTQILYYDSTVKRQSFDFMFEITDSDKNMSVAIDIISNIMRCVDSYRSTFSAFNAQVSYFTEHVNDKVYLVIRSFVPKRFDNVQVMDWFRILRGHPELTRVHVRENFESTDHANLPENTKCIIIEAKNKSKKPSGNYMQYGTHTFLGFQVFNTWRGNDTTFCVIHN